jgi:hypothetical protein
VKLPPPSTRRVIAVAAVVGACLVLGLAAGKDRLQATWRAARSSLLAARVEPYDPGPLAVALPQDVSVAGFDNVAAALGVSPTLLEQSSTDIDITRSPIVPTISPFPPPYIVADPGAFAGGVAVATGFSDRTTVYSAAGEIFPTARLGVRLGYTCAHGDDVLSLATDSAYDLAATWFFRPRVGVQFSYSRDMHDDLADGHGSAIHFIGRL